MEAQNAARYQDADVDHRVLQLSDQWGSYSISPLRQESPENVRADARQCDESSGDDKPGQKLEHSYDPDIDQRHVTIAERKQLDSSYGAYNEQCDGLQRIN